jgi:hypothetical protein
MKGENNMNPNIGADTSSQPNPSNATAPPTSQHNRQPLYRVSRLCCPIRPRPSPPRQKAEIGITPARPDPMSQAVKHDVARVADAWKRYCSTHSRDAVYPLLQTIFDTATKWRAKNRVSEYSRIALGLKGTSVRMYAEPFAVLIFAGCVVDAKTRSRWSRLLRVAEANGARSIESFVKKRGGINRVAGMFCKIEG